MTGLLDIDAIDPKTWEEMPIKIFSPDEFEKALKGYHRQLPDHLKSAFEELWPKIDFTLEALSKPDSTEP